MKTPIKNTLFDAKLHSNVRRFSLLQNASALETQNNENMERQEDEMKKTLFEFSNVACDCADIEMFELFDTVLRYFDSAVSFLSVKKDVNLS